ncbi:hypothetical protein [Cytobacillus horneckiae]|uniref:hypothetical protein n=1 Tax=Cytobacillus horneckiae TaxID=549687 RepID=UPI003D9A5BBA
MDYRKASLGQLYYISRQTKEKEYAQEAQKELNRRDYMLPIVIHRQRKHEAERAIADLQKRGFEVIFPLTEFKRDGKRYDRDNRNRPVFSENTFSSVWMAKLRKVDY